MKNKTKSDELKCLVFIKGGFMDIFKEMNKIIAFLKNNGWKEESPHSDNDYYSFFHNYNYGIDIERSTGEIVVIADIGDILHIQLSHESIYTLVGFLIIHPCDDICLKYKFRSI